MYVISVPCSCCAGCGTNKGCDGGSHPVLNVLPTVPSVMAWPLPPSFLRIGGAWNPCPSNQWNSGQETFLITLTKFCRNHKVGSKKPGVARFQVHVTWPQKLISTFLFLATLWWSDRTATEMRAAVEGELFLEALMIFRTATRTLLSVNAYSVPAASNSLLVMSNKSLI